MLGWPLYPYTSRIVSVITYISVRVYWQNNAIIWMVLLMYGVYVDQNHTISVLPRLHL
jgi:hypothetical protein